MIQFWLTFNNGEERIRFPVPPQTFEIQTGLNNSNVNIHQLGEVMLIGRRKLKTISFSSYFPIREDGLCQYSDFPSPMQMIRMIERWRDSQKPVRLMILGDGLKFNEAMVIENFSFSQKKGPQDVYFTLDLKEYRFLQVRTAKLSDKEMQSLRARPADKEIPNTYIWKKGDTLKKVAKKVYGNDSHSANLKKKNNIKDEHRLPSGYKLMMM